MSEAITLTPAEARMAALVGTERRIESLRAGLHSAPGIKPASVWTIDIEGAGAELAFAKRMGWYWDGSVGVFHDEADVREVNVRRQREHHWDMCIRPRDRHGVYALVTGMLPRYRVHGWARWPECPHYEDTKDPARAPAFYVRQADLLPLELLHEPSGQVSA